jgi:hypothetical protein
MAGKTEVDFSSVPLKSGAHSRRSRDGMCVMELVAWIAGKPHTDRPPCVSRTISTFMIRWNDRLPDDEARERWLRPLVPAIGCELLNTDTTVGDETTRGLMCFDWLVRECLPLWLELTESLIPHAQELRALPVITSRDQVQGLRPLLQKIRKAAAYAAYAAYADAAAYAADDAAYAAYAAAADAAAYAADAAAAYAAYAAAAAAAAYAAARRRLTPTTRKVNASAQELVRRMCAVGRA